MLIHSSNKLHWISWTLVTTIGSTGGSILGGSLGDYFGDYQILLYGLILIAICGVFIGFGQWLILRTRVNNSSLWIPATVFGFLLGSIIGFLIDQFLSEFIHLFPWVDIFIISSIFGIITGVFQWIVLHKNLAGAFRWCLISSLSWGLGFVISFALNLDFKNWVLRDAITGAVIGIGAGAISGVFIKPLITYRETESVDS